MTNKILGGVVSLLLLASVAVGGCLQDAGLLKASLNCVGMPTIPKYFDPQVFTWDNGTEAPNREILAVSDGNEILLWNITNPASPVYISGSNFNVPNQGDSDYDMMAFSVCDGCRFGIATFKLGYVIWDMGVSLNPSFGQRKFYQVSQGPRGAFTFSEDGGQQYIAAKYLPGDLSGMLGPGTLYKVNGVDGLVPLQRIDVSQQTPWTKISGGVQVHDGYIYLAMLDNTLYTYRFMNGSLSFINKSPISAYIGRGRGVSVNNYIAISASMDGGKVWNIGTPAAPVLLSSVPGNYQYAALSGNFAAFVGNNNIPKTFDISMPSMPLELDQQFWDLDNPWNDYGTSCEFPTGLAFSIDGSRMFLGRYAVLQVVNFSGCGDAPTPVPTSTPVPQPTRTPTPTPPPWPTPPPTCVPGCIPQVPTCVPGCIRSN